MRISIDLDGTICALKRADQEYDEVEPLPGAQKTIARLRSDGHVVIINTARRMRTHNGNVGAVVAEIGKATIDWLQKHQIGYDEIHFGKPYADIYLDDLAVRFNGDWTDFEKWIK